LLYTFLNPYVTTHSLQIRNYQKYLPTFYTFFLSLFLSTLSSFLSLSFSHSLFDSEFITLYFFLFSFLLSFFDVCNTRAITAFSRVSFVCRNVASIQHQTVFLKKIKKMIRFFSSTRFKTAFSIWLFLNANNFYF
jgi:hypothetical protein